MAELQLTTADLAGIMGTGAGNRVTIKDLESFLHKIEPNGAEASKIRAGVADAMRRSWTRPLSTDRFISESRSRATRSAIARSEARSRPLRAACARARAGGKSNRSGEVHWEPRGAIKLDST